MERFERYPTLRRRPRATEHTSQSIATTEGDTGYRDASNARARAHRESAQEDRSPMNKIIDQELILEQDEDKGQTMIHWHQRLLKKTTTTRRRQERNSSDSRTATTCDNSLRHQQPETSDRRPRPGDDVSKTKLTNESNELQPLHQKRTTTLTTKSHERFLSERLP